MQRPAGMGLEVQEKMQLDSHMDRWPAQSRFKLPFTRRPPYSWPG